MERSSSGEGDSSRFASALRRLKREGGTLLVTGAVGPSVRAAQSRRLFGAPDERRARVLALADETSPSAYLPESVTPDDDRVAVVAHGDAVRSVATASAEPLPLRPEDPLAAFHRETAAAVRAERASGPLEAGELRVGVVGLGRLVDRYGAERMRATVASLGETVADARGLCHWHLAGPDAGGALASRETFDARIELRRRGGRPPEQRWHLPELAEPTEWMSL